MNIEEIKKRALEKAKEVLKRKKVKEEECLRNGFELLTNSIGFFSSVPHCNNLLSMLTICTGTKVGLTAKKAAGFLLVTFTTKRSPEEVEYIFGAKQNPSVRGEFSVSIMSFEKELMLELLPLVDTQLFCATPETSVVKDAEQAFIERFLGKKLDKEFAILPLFRVIFLGKKLGRITYQTTYKVEKEVFAAILAHTFTEGDLPSTFPLDLSKSFVQKKPVELRFKIRDIMLGKCSEILTSPFQEESQQLRVNPEIMSRNDCFEIMDVFGFNGKEESVCLVINSPSYHKLLNIVDELFLDIGHYIRVEGTGIFVKDTKVGEVKVTFQKGTFSTNAIFDLDMLPLMRRLKKSDKFEDVNRELKEVTPKEIINTRAQLSGIQEKVVVVRDIFGFKVTFRVFE